MATLVMQIVRVVVLATARGVRCPPFVLGGTPVTPRPPIVGAKRARLRLTSVYKSPRGRRPWPSTCRTRHLGSTKLDAVAADEMPLGLVSLVVLDTYRPGAGAFAGLRGSPDVPPMTGNADRRQPRYYATHADAERAKAIVCQQRPHERLEVVGLQLGSGKPTGVPGDRCRFDDCREAS